MVARSIMGKVHTSKNLERELGGLFRLSRLCCKRYRRGMGLFAIEAVDSGREGLFGGGALGGRQMENLGLAVAGRDWPSARDR